MFEIFQWLTTAASIGGTILNIRRNRWCFYVWAVTNASWTVIDACYGIWSQAALQAVYFGLAIWGIRSWRAAA